MALVAVDASVVVAALLSWHEAHPAAFGALTEVLESDELLVPMSTLIECYAVLTRLPAPHRLSPTAAGSLLEDSLRGAGRVVGMRTAGAWPFLGALVDEDVRGGATYDRRILEEARGAGAERLLTLNGADFRRFALDALEIVVPGAAH